jgi:cobalt/nickel transport system permease protein
MRHSFLDRYSSLSSPIHRLDPRAKIVALFSFLLIVVFTPITLGQKFVLYGALVFSLVVISKVPVKFVIKRSLVIIPFVGLVAIGLPFLGNDGGSLNLGIFAITPSTLLLFLNVIVKSWLCVVAMIVLTSTTPFSRLLRGLQGLKMPTVFVMILSFMYRFTFILEDELERMVRAREARSFKPTWLQSVKAAGNIIGNLLVRSYERGERVYAAMRSRGYDGEIKLISELKMNSHDALFITIFLSLLILILVV